MIHTDTAFPRIGSRRSRSAGFTILESLIMLAVLTVLGLTTLAIYRKGPPPEGWLGSKDTSAPSTHVLLEDAGTAGLIDETAAALPAKLDSGAP